MKINRREKKPKKLTYYEQLIKRLKKNIERAENEAVTDEWLTALEDAPTFKKDKHSCKATKADIEEKIKLEKFLARSRVVKKAFADAERLESYIQENYGNELNYSKEYLFPTQWMLKNKRIAEAMKNRPIIIDAINYITNRSRRLSKKQRKKMFELTKSVIGGEKYKGEGKKYKEYAYTVFLADAAFYDEAAKAINCSVSKAKAVITGELVDIGAVKKLGTVATGESGHPPGLYADGYLTERRKIPFLKNTKEFRKALRGLSKKNSG